MRLGLLYDHTFSEKPSGASRFADRMIATAPVDIVHCRPGSVDRDCDAYMLFSTKRYGAEEYEHVLTRPFVRFELDYWRNGDGAYEWRDKLNGSARLIGFCSPLHREVYEAYHGSVITPTICLPCPVDEAALASYRSKWADRERGGTIWYGSWAWGKAPDIAQRWALENAEPTDFYSPNIPDGTRPMNGYSHIHGFAPEREWWDVVASHRTFVHFPRQPEPWPWSVHEAYVLGLEIVMAGRFGIESYQGGVEQAVEQAEDSPARWWEEALNVLS